MINNSRYNRPIFSDIPNHISRCFCSGYIIFQSWSTGFMINTSLISTGVISILLCFVQLSSQPAYLTAHQYPPSCVTNTWIKILSILYGFMKSSGTFNPPTLISSRKNVYPIKVWFNLLLSCHIILSHRILVYSTKTYLLRSLKFIDPNPFLCLY